LHLECRFCSFFFFSSRRRHTRFSRDWSSDVCSSDLDKRLNYDPQRGDDISSLYQDDGYLFFNIDPVEVNVQGDSIDIELRIVEGPQVTVNSVSIEGNERTSDHVVDRKSVV